MAPLPPILILAAGRSSRMAPRDKLAEPVGGVPLLTRIVRAALDTGAPTFVALPAADHPRAALVPHGARPLSVPGSAEGMGGTIRDAVARLPVARQFMLLPADLPGIGQGEIAQVLAAPGDAPHALIWRGATAEGAPGHPILFASAVRPDFAALAGDDGAKAIVARHGGRVHLVPLPGPAAVEDLDTPADWARFRARTGL